MIIFLIIEKLIFGIIERKLFFFPIVKTEDIYLYYNLGYSQYQSVLRLGHNFCLMLFFEIKTGSVCAGIVNKHLVL